MSSSQELKPGQLIGDRYRLDRELGRGAMGVVYQATHNKLGHKVALKFLDKEFKRSPEVVERFVREGRAALAIGHPGIVGVLDFGEMSDGTSYLVMEHLDGLTLRALGKQVGVFRPSIAAAVLLPVLDALEAAHAVGVIHRDLKPANVMLTSRRQVKLVDFGISKINESKLTRAGAAMGTPDYMAPEQTVDAVSVTSAADLYSVGVMAYELLSGRLPLTARTVPEMMYKALSEKPPPLAQVATGLKPRLAELVDSLLLKDPRERPRSASVVRALLSDAAPPDTKGLWELVSSPSEIGPTYVRPSPEAPRPSGKKATFYKPDTGPRSVPPDQRETKERSSAPRPSPVLHPAHARVQIPAGVPVPQVVAGPELQGPKTGPPDSEVRKATLPAPTEQVPAAPTERHQPISTTGTLPVSAPPRRSAAVPLMVGLLFFSAVFAGGAIWRSLQPAPVAKKPVVVEEKQQLPPPVVVAAKVEPAPVAAPPEEKKPDPPPPAPVAAGPKKADPPPPRPAPAKVLSPTDILFRDGRLAEQAGNHAAAKAKFEQCVATDDQHADCMCALASVLTILEDPNAAKRGQSCQSLRR